MNRRRLRTGSFLIALISTTAVGALLAEPMQKPAVGSKVLPTGALLVSNPGTGASSFAIPTGYKQPVVFELGRENRHWRRVYPQSSLLNVRSGTSYEIWEADRFADYALTTICSVDPVGMKTGDKLKRLAVRLSDLRSSRITEARAYQIRLLSEAYQALLGIEFRCVMKYPAAGSADYRLFAGRDFEVGCTVANHGSEPLTGCSARVIAPDEWTVGTRSPVPTRLGAKSSANARSLIRAPEQSMLRPKQSPIIAELVFRHAGRKILVHYPCVVELSNPLTASQKITSAGPSDVTAEISIASLFAGMGASRVTAAPYIPEGIKVHPASQAHLFQDAGRFIVTYRKDGVPSPTLRAVTLRIKQDEHTVFLRSVMEAYLPLGRRAYGEALWMNASEDATVVSATIADTRCRQTTSGGTDDERYMYFTVSPNFPTSGNTYVTVSYFDGTRGTFRLQYDSADQSARGGGVYKDSRETVRMADSGEWRTTTFVLPDAAFANRENAQSDFRLMAVGTDLAIAEMTVSKFPAADTRTP